MKRQVAAVLLTATCLASHDGNRIGQIRLGACAPPPPYPFAQAIVPDAPGYVQGQLGIVQRFFARRYLLVAWRYVSAAPLTGYEQSAVIAAPTGAADQYASDLNNEALQRWMAARAAIPTGTAAPTAIGRWKAAPRDAYPYYLNCPDAAFAAAADTLALLVKEYGPTSPFTIDWVAAQDRVFKRCAEAGTEPALAELPATSPALARRERTYQIAAAAFYGGSWDAAERGFRAVAGDRSSRWQPWGRYLAARTLVRRATLAPGPSAAFDPVVLAAAEEDFLAVVRESTDARVRNAAEQMLRYVRLRTRPETTALTIAEELQRPRSSGPVASDFHEYRFLLDRMVGDTVDYTYESIEATTPLRQKNEMTDWVLTYQASGRGATEHAVERWRAIGSEAWLMAAVSKIDAGHPAMRDVIDAAGRVAVKSPAFATVAFHRARLLIEDGHPGEARALLDPLLALTWPGSTVNLFRAARLRTARSLAEFLADAVRVPVASPDYSGGRELGFDTDSTDVLNERLPLSMLASAAESRQLPVYLRRDMAIAAFTRAVLLGADDRIATLSAVLVAAAPELASSLARVRAAGTPESRRMEAWHVVLRHPGLRPFVPRYAWPRNRLNQLDPLREHWWCPFSSAPSGTRSALEPGADFPYYASYEAEFSRHWRDPQFLRALYPTTTRPESPAFLADAERVQAQRELEALGRLGASATVLARQAVVFARANASDPRAPEALYLGVRATRYGCTDDATGKWSRAAFDLLHRQYPRSEWAKRTPYWYR